ncbi:MAG: glycosyltransferase family A protein, partial [Thermodesulfobacteriota bacterium]|nr:glycosyltransferase family A protein [Thermodesulfobacteriota bacterium]
MPKEKYVIITPVRDEQNYVEKTIKSVISQTVTPIEWMIVNDGSTDNTRRILDEYAHQQTWIKTVHRENRGHREAGRGVIEAFCDGYDSLEATDWEFIVKLDGDLSFDSDYFERCFYNFHSSPRLGISGGGIYHIIFGQTILEKDPLFHVRGATKIYKRACWKDIGGLLKAPGWDTLDEVKANMLGWKTRTFPELQLIHLRRTGEADGAWANWVKNGRANYISGYHPLFMFFKCLKRGF